MRKVYEGTCWDKSKEERLATKKQFVENLGWLLSQTRVGVARCYLDDKDMVHIVDNAGEEIWVNVECDSYIAIIRDVTNKL